jgi:AbrB family looped-hinge helix DNA binding protein
MVATTLTSKGQVTVPAAIREQLKLVPGDRLIFEVDGESVRIRVATRRAARELLGSLAPRQRFAGREVERQAVAASLAHDHVGGRR